MTSGPKRLSDSGGGELGRSLSAARAHLPDAKRLAAVAERLAELGLPVAEPSGIKVTPDATPPVAAPSSSVLVKGVAVALATGGALTLALVLSGRQAATPSGVEPRLAPPAASASVAEASAAPVGRARSVPTRRAPLPHAGVPQVEPSPPVPARARPNERGNAAREREPEHERQVAPSGAALAPPNGAARPNDVRTPTTSSAPAVSGDAPAPAQPSTPASSAAGDERGRGPARSEVELLKQARGALGGDPERALLLTRRHGAEFPHGTYAQERDFIAISALLRLGRRDEANLRAGAFRGRYPRSAYLPQLERLLGGR